MIIDDLKNSIIDLYQNIKIRKQSDAKLIDKAFLEQEKKSLSSISSLLLIDYIKIHLNLLIDIKVNEKISQIKDNPINFIHLYGSDIPANDYEKLLRRYEGDIRNYIKLVNMLKIHIDELNEKQEILETQIEQMQKETLNLIPTTQSIEYKKKIEELTALIKTYEKHNLKIPLLEKKIKNQKIELYKLDSFYKNQIKSYTKKLEDYEKGIYLTKNTNIMKKSNNIKSNINTSIYYKKSKNRINSISPKRENSASQRELKATEKKPINNMKKTRSINNIFFTMKNNEISNNLEKNINFNLNKNLNGGNLYEETIREKNENTMLSPKFAENKIIDSYYDSIETENDNKTLNAIGTITNLRKKIKLKYKFNINKILIKNKENHDNNINTNKKIQTRSNSKKIVKRNNNHNNNNRSSIKIPKNIPDHINTSKYIHTKEKNIPKINRYSSLKFLNNGKNKSIQNLKKDNEQFNKTFSKIHGMNNTHISTGHNNSINNHQTQKNNIKKFILNKISAPTIINGRTPIPLQRTQSKTCSFIK